jgi:hypothetical protein
VRRVILAGCSSSGSGSASSTSTSTGSCNDTTTSVSVPPYNVLHDAQQDAIAGACTDNASNGWTLKGTVQNSSTSSRSHSIAVDFVTMPGDTVRATRVVNVGPLAAHASANWSTPAAGQGHANLNCVIRQASWS